MNRELDVTTLDFLHERLGELEGHIQRRLNGRVRDLRLSIRDNGLVLEGHTHTYHAKQLAQHAVMEAVDMPISANEIEVYLFGRTGAESDRGSANRRPQCHRMILVPPIGQQ